MAQRFRIIRFAFFAVFTSCLVSCQDTYDFKLAGTVLNAENQQPVANAWVQVFPWDVSTPEGKELIDNELLERSTAFETKADGQYLVTYWGNTCCCGSSVGPDHIETYFIWVAKSGFDTLVVGITSDELTKEFPPSYHRFPPVYLVPDTVITK